MQDKLKMDWNVIKESKCCVLASLFVIFASVPQSCHSHTSRKQKNTSQVKLGASSYSQCQNQQSKKTRCDFAPSEIWSLTGPTYLSDERIVFQSDHFKKSNYHSYTGLSPPQSV